MATIYQPDEDNRSIGIGAFPINSNETMLIGMSYQELMDLCHANATWDVLKRKNPDATIQDALKKEFEDQIKFHIEAARERFNMCLDGMTRALAKEYDVRIDLLPTFDGKTVHDKKSVREDLNGWDNVKPGTLLGQDIADDFYNDMMPVCSREDCLQHGEPASHNEKGFTYRTLKRVADGVYEYCGLCNKGKNVA